MHTAVIIPYRPQTCHATLAWTLEGYAYQQLTAGQNLEVHVGLDGPAEDPNLPLGGDFPVPITFHKYPWIGAAAVRNQLVREVSTHTDLLIFGNADARPAPDFVHQHARIMSTLPPQCLILGSAPWERTAPTVMDVLIDSTPMIFSYCHATAHYWYPFRIAYSLNLAVRYANYLACGGFHDLIRPYYYEDLAFGCRMLGPTRQGLFYAPEAQVLHRHPMTFPQYLDREELLGIMAPVLARHCPPAFAVLMGGRTAENIARNFTSKVQADTKVHRQLYQRLSEKLVEPATTLGAGPDRVRALGTLYQLHIPVKLLAFRLGFLRGMELLDDQHWQERRPAGRWRLYVEVP